MRFEKARLMTGIAVTLCGIVLAHLEHSVQSALVPWYAVKDSTWDRTIPEGNNKGCSP